jgi:hypothetical protein
MHSTRSLIPLERCTSFLPDTGCGVGQCIHIKSKRDHATRTIWPGHRIINHDFLHILIGAEIYRQPFINVKPDKDEVTRMHTASVEIEAGKAYLPEKTPWLEEFQKEILAFPGGTHDDQVDSMSQFLNWKSTPRTMSVLPLGGF